MKQVFSGKVIGICFIVSILGYIVFPAAYGGTFGIYLANKFGEQEFLEKAEKIYENPPITGELYRKVALSNIVKEELTSSDKLAIIISANVVAFGILGLIAGVLTSQWLAPVIIPLLLLPLSLRVLKTPLLVIEYPITTTLIGVVMQVVAVCVAAYFGSLLRGWLAAYRQRKLTEKAST